MSGRPWIYGQFRDVVLPAVCHILDSLTSVGGRNGSLRPTERGDPVRVARAVTHAVSEGVLVGRWDGNYGDGKMPSEWTGSVAILEEFMKTGGNRPVNQLKDAAPKHPWAQRHEELTASFDRCAAQFGKA